MTNKQEPKPLCAVNGVVDKGRICGKVLVGMKHCGNPLPCPHKVEQKEGEK